MKFHLKCNEARPRVGQAGCKYRCIRQVAQLFGPVCQQWLKLHTRAHSYTLLSLPACLVRDCGQSKGAAFVFGSDTDL